MKELKMLLSKYKFKQDKQKHLLEAFRELDQDGDGFIPKNELAQFMQTMGEPLEDEEINYLLTLVEDEEEKKGMVNIQLLTKILIPSDNFNDDLYREAD